MLPDLQLFFRFSFILWQVYVLAIMILKVFLSVEKQVNDIDVFHVQNAQYNCEVSVLANYPHYIHFGSCFYYANVASLGSHEISKVQNYTV